MGVCEWVMETLMDHVFLYLLLLLDISYKIVVWDT